MWWRVICRLKGNSQSYFHTLQVLDVSPTCDAADVKSVIQLFPHSSQHVTGNSSHSFSDAPLQIIDIGTLRDFFSIRTQDMDLESVVFVKQIFESVYFFLNNPLSADHFSIIASAPFLHSYLSSRKPNNTVFVRIHHFGILNLEY
jgi:hypothetical protein